MIQNYQKFLNFQHTKYFNNILDYSFNRDLQFYLQKSRLLKDKSNYERYRMTTNYSTNYISIYSNINNHYMTVLRLYKELQLDNNINACTYLALAPLFLSVDDVCYYLDKQDVFSEYNFYNLLYKLISNMMASQPPSMRQKLERFNTPTYNEIQHKYLIKGLTPNIIKKILNNIGLTPQFHLIDFNRKNNKEIHVFDTKSNFPVYPLLWGRRYIGDNQRRHCEIMDCIDDSHFIEEYVDRPYTSYQNFLDMSIDDEDPELFHPLPEEDEFQDTNVTITFDDNEEAGMNSRVRRRISRMPNRNLNQNNRNIMNKNSRNVNNNNIQRIRRNINNRNIIRNINKNKRPNANFNNRINKKLNNVIKIQNPKTINMNITRNDKNMIITGKDIILTQDNKLNTNGLFACIPINPAYWDNTRIKNLAILNQYYIPIKIKIEYVPLVSKFQKGNITIGTISNSTMTENNIQSTLISSTSGITYSCSTSFVREIQINSLIQQRKLLINSKLDKESVPFYICIFFNNIKDNGEDILPGQFYINYMFKFFNPVTVPGTFKSQQNIKLSDYDNTFFNISCFLMEDNNNCKIGSILDVEYKDDKYIYELNGTEVDVDVNKLATFFYSEQYKPINPDPPQPEPIEKIDFDITSFDDSGSGVTFDLENGFNILIDIPYSYEYIEITLVRAGVSTLSTTLSQSYYTIKKSTDYENDSLPPPLNDILCQIISISAQANYTKMRLSTEYVNIIN